MDDRVVATRLSPPHRGIDGIELKGPGSEPDADAPDPSSTPGSTLENPILLVCRACGLAITTDAERTERDGAHEHVFFNPAGILFRIGCFVSAQGCLGIGPRETHFTWFPGHAWQTTVCGRCAVHLGWSFTGPTRFFGLILDRLVESRS